MAAVDNPSGAHTDTLVTDNEDGTYSVSYTPFEEGIHTLSVKFGGDHIPGSPFKVSFQSSSLDSDDDFRSGCRNVSQCHHKQSFSGLRSRGRSCFYRLMT